jgi:hypothetical protein
MMNLTFENLRKNLKRPLWYTQGPGDGGHEQLISNGERIKPAFAEKEIRSRHERYPRNLDKLV